MRLGVTTSRQEGGVGRAFELTVSADSDSCVRIQLHWPSVRIYGDPCIDGLTTTSSRDYFTGSGLCEEIPVRTSVRIFRLGYAYRRAGIVHT